MHTSVLAESKTHTEREYIYMDFFECFAIVS